MNSPSGARAANISAGHITGSDNAVWPGRGHGPKPSGSSGKSRTNSGTASRGLTNAVDIFIQDKKVQGVSADVVNKYTRLLGRLTDYCEARSVFAVHGISREVITGFCSTCRSLSFQFF